MKPSAALQLVGFLVAGGAWFLPLLFGIEEGEPDPEGQSNYFAHVPWTGRVAVMLLSLGGVGLCYWAWAYAGRIDRQPTVEELTRDRS